jgi:glutaminyl-peptide cyclotransferase
MRCAGQHQRGLGLGLPFISALLLIGCHSRSADRTPLEIWKQCSGEKALAHVQHLVDLGPRPPGSEAIEKARQYIGNQLQAYGWQMSRQQFVDNTPRGPVQFVNLIARFGPAPPSFLLCSHYDTKIFENLRFVGANDGGSSTGLLLELARVLAARPELAGKVQLVFFDGEEAYEQFSARDGLYGSRHFAADLAARRIVQQFRGGLLFDMVGDCSLDITLPLDSPADMARDLFASADALGLRNYFTYLAGGEVTDDHTPLNSVGVPTMDVIDFDYAWWHTADDTIDKVSADSLQTVGSVALYYLVNFAFK